MKTNLMKKKNGEEQRESKEGIEKRYRFHDHRTCNKKRGLDT